MHTLLFLTITIFYMCCPQVSGVSYCNPGFHYAEGGCVQCHPGTYSTLTLTAVCESCPAGTYASGHQSTEHPHAPVARQGPILQPTAAAAVCSVLKGKLRRVEQHHAHRVCQVRMAQEGRASVVWLEPFQPMVCVCSVRLGRFQHPGPPHARIALREHMQWAGKFAYHVPHATMEHMNRLHARRPATERAAHVLHRAVVARTKPFPAHRPVIESVAHVLLHAVMAHTKQFPVHRPATDSFFLFSSFLISFIP